MSSVAELRESLRKISFPPLDPFVASMVGAVWAGMGEAYDDRRILLPLNAHFEKPFPVDIDLQHGPDAPMLLILPGVGAGSDSGHARAFKRIMRQQGVNYVSVPNPWSMQWQNALPKHDPGILPQEAKAVYEALEVLRERFPDYFDVLSATGYSYGAMWGATLLRHQQDAQARDSNKAPLIRAFAAISPPERMTGHQFSVGRSAQSIRGCPGLGRRCR